MLKNFFLLIFFPSIIFSLEIKGKILSKENQKPLGDVVIILKDEKNQSFTKSTEKDGSFYFTELEEGAYEIEVKAIGFYSEKKSFYLKKNETFTFYLSPLSTVSLGEIEVKGEKEKVTSSKITIDRKTIQKASASITSDPLEIVKKMPGVDTATYDMGNPSKLGIRGGGGYESSGLLDGILLNYFYHNIIADSIFIDELIDEIVLYKGVVPVEYGQVMSGILDAKTITPPQGFHGKLDLGVLNTYLTVCGTTEDEKWSYLWGIRRTHYDLVLRLFLQQSDMIFTLPYYIDSQGKISYSGENDKISILYVYSFEDGMITNLANTNKEGKTNDLYGQINNNYFVCGLKWQHIFSSKFFIDQQASFALNNQKSRVIYGGDELYLGNNEKNLRYKITGNYFPFDNFGLKAGFEGIYYPELTYSNFIKGDYTNILTQQVEYTNFTEKYGKSDFLVLSPFLGCDIELFDKKVLLSSGIRYNYFTYIRKSSFDPRGTIEYRIDKNNKVYLSAGYLSQFPSDSFVLTFFPSDKEKLAIPGVWHYVIGESSKFFDLWEFSIEGYLKKYENLLETVSNIGIEITTTDGRLDIYGLEILLKKNPGEFPFYGWLSLSIMDKWSYLTEGVDPNRYVGMNFNIDPQTGDISGGINSAWEYAHQPPNEWCRELSYKVNLTVAWEFLKNWSITVEGNYKSGAYYTPVTNATAITIGTNTIYVPEYGKYNSEKLPDYHELNLKLEWTPVLWNLPCGFYIQIMNIYNNKPLYRYNYNEDYSEKEPVYSPVGIYGLGGFWIKW